MRNPLNKRIPREFKKNIGKYMGLFLILIATIMAGSAFMATLESVRYTSEKNASECRVEDGQFETEAPISGQLRNQLEEEEEITLVNNYYSSVTDFLGDATVFVFEERRELNLPTVFQGELPHKQDEIAVERLFAQNRHIEIGDKITLQDQEFTVTATIAVPDYSSLFKNNQDLVMNTSDFGITLVSEAGFDRFQENTITYRYAYKFDESLDGEKDREKAEEMQESILLDGATLQSFLGAEDNQSISFLKNDMGHDGPMMRVFIYLLIVIIAFVFTILTNNMIESEATIIGTLRASGYKKSEIVAHYLTPTMIIALVSSVVGNVVGYTFMLQPFEDLYYDSYSIAPLEIQFNLEAFITTTVLPVVIMILINWFMLYKKLSLSPLKFLRKDLNRKKQKRAIRLPDFSFLTRFRMRVLLQNKGSYFILFIGIFISSFLLMFGIGVGPLIDHYVEEVDSSLPYEYQYVLKASVEVQGGEKVQSYTLKTWYDLGEVDMNIAFMGIAEDSEFFENITLPHGENEITISKSLADKMDLQVNDELTFTDDYDDEEYTLKVANIYDYSGSITVFMRRENLNDMLGNEVDTFNSYLSNENLTIDDQYLAKKITRSDIIGGVEQVMKSFDGVIQIISIFSVGIYMILMYILTKTVIEKNALAISYMKVFGYDSREIGKLYLNATTIIVIVSLFICIPVEALCFRYVLIYMASKVEGYIPFYLPAWVYMSVIVIGIAAYFAINALHVRKVKKIPMSEALKNGE